MDSVGTGVKIKEEVFCDVGLNDKDDNFYSELSDRSDVPQELNCDNLEVEIKMESEESTISNELGKTSVKGEDMNFSSKGNLGMATAEEEYNFRDLDFKVDSGINGIESFISGMQCKDLREVALLEVNNLQKQVLEERTIRDLEIKVDLGINEIEKFINEMQRKNLRKAALQEIKNLGKQVWNERTIKDAEISALKEELNSLKPSKIGYLSKTLEEPLKQVPETKIKIEKDSIEENAIDSPPSVTEIGCSAIKYEDTLERFMEPEIEIKESWSTVAEVDSGINEVEKFTNRMRCNNLRQDTLQELKYLRKYAYQERTIKDSKIKALKGEVASLKASKSIVNGQSELDQVDMKEKPLDEILEENLLKEMIIETILLKDSKPFNCTACSYSTVAKLNLKRHIEHTHSNHGQFQCTCCQFSTNHEIDLKNHLITVHSGEDGIKCQYCDFCTRVKDSLDNHINEVHLRIRNYACEKCGFKTNRRENLLDHIDGNCQHKIFRYIKTFQCTKCEFSTKKRCSLITHVEQMHLGLMKFHCTICDYSINCRYLLRDHLNTVHSQKLFKCDQCKYSSNRKDRLKTHVDHVHLKLKPFACKKCHYKTDRKSLIVKHSKIHS